MKNWKEIEDGLYGLWIDPEITRAEWIKKEFKEAMEEMVGEPIPQAWDCPKRGTNEPCEGCAKLRGMYYQRQEMLDKISKFFE